MFLFYRRAFYEGGVRSPSVVRCVTPPGAVSDVPWAFWDVLPTLLEMAGAPLPRNGTFDGRSIVPALRGEPMRPPPYLFWTWRGEAAEEASSSVGLARTRLGPFSAVESGAAARRGLVGESRRRGPGYAAPPLVRLAPRH